MHDVVLAAVLAAGSRAQPSTLAGMTLGNNVAQVLSRHPDAQKSADSSVRWWTWSVDGGGTVIVTADDSDKINRVDFIADKGATNTIDVPCAGVIPVQASPAYLEQALKTTPCSAYNGAAYGVPGGSVVDVRFAGIDSGSLIEARWYRPTADNPSPVGELREVLDYVRPVLPSIGGGVVISSAGACPANDNGTQDIFFPSVYLQPAKGRTGVDALRQIFRDDPNVTIVQGQSRPLRISIGSVSSALFATRIDRLALNSRARYDPQLSLSAIMATPEVATAEGGSNAQFIWRGRLRMICCAIPQIGANPPEDAPHLPSIMQNITVDEAFDAVARTFKGFVTYTSCTQPDGETLFQLDHVRGS
jgi:hypothetical protein